MASDTPLQVVLVKSGVTAWDAVGRCSGTADLPLCAEGLRSAEQCAKQLVAVPASGVLSGPDTASLETAAVLSRHVGGRVRAVEGWAEPTMGLWEGLSDEQLAERFPKAYRQWKQDPSSVSIPEAEQLDETQTRIVEEFAKVVGRKRVPAGQAVVAVMRPMTLGLVVCWLESRPLSELWAVIAGLGTCKTVTIDRARLKRPRLVGLRGVGAGAGAGR